MRIPPLLLLLLVTAGCGLPYKTLPELIVDLDSDDPTVKREATERVVKVGKPVVPDLIKAAYRSPGALECLVRMRAVAVPELVQAMHSPYTDYYVALAALPLIGKPGYASAAKQYALPEIEQRPQDFIAFAGRMGPEFLEALVPVAVQEEKGSVAHRAVVPYGQEALPELKKILDSGDTEDRQGAVEILYEIGRPALGLLIKSLDDPDDGVFTTASRAIAYQVGPTAREAAPALVKQTQSESPTRRNQAAKVLMATCSDRDIVAPAVLEVIIANKDDDRNHWLVISLQPMATHVEDQAERLLDFACQATDSFNEGAESIDIIAGMSPEAIDPLVPRLAEIVVNGRSFMEDSAAEILWRTDIDVTPAMPILLPELGQTRRASKFFDFMVDLGDKAVPDMQKAMYSDNDDIGRMAAMVLSRMDNMDVPTAAPVLYEALQSDNVDAICRSAEALADQYVDSEVAVPMLIQLLEHPSDKVRGMTAYSLARYRVEGGPALPKLKQALETEESEAARKQLQEAIHDLETYLKEAQ